MRLALIALLFAPVVHASTVWNGDAITAWNGDAITAFNGVDIGSGGGGGGPDTYYYSQVQGSGTPGEFYPSQLYLSWGEITVVSGGTCTEIGVWQSFVGGTGNIKLALYDASNNRVAVSSPVACGGTAAWMSATISVSVSAGTYKVGWIPDGATMGFEMNTAGADVGRSVDNQDYSAGPPATLPANGNPPGGSVTVRMYVD